MSTLQSDANLAVTMKLRTLRLLLILCLASTAIAVPASSQVTVIFTRHAEKALTPPKDPVLSSAGEQRANQLSAMLADAGVDAIYVTEFQRTQQTAAPLAARVQVKPTVLRAKDTAALVQAIRSHQSGVVVVVGHSNTLPEIISALGGPKIDISDSEYDNLYLLTVGPSQSSLLRLHYGDSMPGPASGMDPKTTPAPVK